MDCKKALKSGIIATTLLVAAISITTTTTTATNVQAVTTVSRSLLLENFHVAEPIHYKVTVKVIEMEIARE
jgi:hypothetical protein